MPIALSQEDVSAYLDPFLAEQAQQPATPQSMFGIAPPMPTTSFFAPRGGYRSPYGGSRSQDPYAVAEKANEYRMAQAAEQQAAQLFQEFQQVDSGSADYPRLRQQLAFKYPLATKHPAGKALVDSADFRFQQTQRTDPNQAFLQRAAMAGVRPEEVAQFMLPDGSVDMVALANLAGERQRSYKPQRAPQDREIEDLQEAYKALDLSRDPNAKAEKARVGALIVEATRRRWGGEQPQAAAPAIPATAPPRVQIKSITPIE